MYRTWVVRSYDNNIATIVKTLALSCGYSQTKGRLFEVKKDVIYLLIIITIKEKIYNFCYFWQEAEVATFGGSLLLEFAKTILSPISGALYFGNLTVVG